MLPFRVLFGPVHRTLVIVLLISLTAGLAVPVPAREPPRLQRRAADEVHMGTQVRIVVYAADEAAATQALQAAFARFAELEQILSDYRSDSEAMQLAASAPHAQPVKVSHDLWFLVGQSLEWSRKTDGAFDITVGPLTRLWRRARRQNELPDSERLAEARQRVGYQLITRDADAERLQLRQAEMRLDFGGIAKGYAAAEAVRVLAAHGCPRALVDAGGDIALGDPPPGESGWRIGVASVKDGEPPRYWLRLSNCVIATSGDLWQFLEVDGVRYSHILDPRTGMGVNRRASATVISRDGCAADALASALCVAGPEAGLKLAKKHDAAALLLTIDDGELQEHATESFRNLRDSAAP